MSPTSSSPTPDPGVAESLKSAVGELWRYKWVIPAVVVLVTSVLAFVTLRKPKVYEAAATLEYDPNPAVPLGDAIEGQNSGWWDSLEFYETQNFVLRSRSLAERVVRKLGLHQDPEYLGVPEEERATFKASPVEEVAADLQGSLDVELVRDTRVVQLSVQDGDPDRAALLANTFAEAYIEKSLEDRLGATARALEWLSEQTQNLKGEVESSNLALYKFREENHALSSSLEERQKIIANQLQAYSSTLTELRSKRIQTGARLSVLKELLAEAEDPSSLFSTPLATDPTVSALRDKARDAALTLQRFSVTYGEAHPQVQTAKAEFETLRKQLEQQIVSMKRGVEAELKEAELAEHGIQQALDEVNRQGLALSLQEIQYSRLDRERSSKAELYEMVMERAAQTNLTRAMKVANARIVDRAVRPVSHVSPRVRTTLVFGGLLGLALGIGFAFALSQLDNKVRGASDLEVRGLAVLGVLPAVEGSATQARRVRRGSKRGRDEDSGRDLIVHLQPRSTMAECCRTIRTNITFQSADDPPKTLAVTSATPRDGKTTVAISLAITLAQSGRRVLLIDTDLRRPRIHRAFDLPSGAGVTSVLAGELPLDEAVQASQVPDLSLLQCGPLPPNPAELLHTRRFAELLAEARAKFDTVVLDTPPIGVVTDPAIIATQVDGTVLVVRARTTSRAGLEGALRRLRGISARVLGGIVNDVRQNDGETYYAHYRTYYGEEQSPPPADAAQSRA
ncbi:MAG: polysaccharide biosynthesis tyrosine autokinase [Myxococcales bacterium]